MTAPVATEAQIRATMLDLITRYGERDHVFAVRAEPSWNGAEFVHVANHGVRVVPCVSPLAVREALAAHDGRSEYLVMLVDRDPRDLGADVVARLARNRVFAVDPWETVRGLFRAQQIDPDLVGNAAVAAALVEAVPSTGFPAAPGGFLTADFAWGTLLDERLGLPRDPSFGDLLKWAERAGTFALWNSLSASVRTGLTDWLRGRFGPAAASVLSLVDAGRGDEAIPIGLVLAVIEHQAPDGTNERALARARLESTVEALPTGAARFWAADSERLMLERLTTEAEAAGRPLGLADQLLDRVGAGDYAYLSDLLDRGFDQRLANAATEALRCARGAEHADLDRAISDVDRHVDARSSPPRARAARMAVRLARWLATNGASEWEPGSFIAASEAHADELGWVDWARRELWPGDKDPAVNAVYSELTAIADATRTPRDRRFADLLAGWLAAGTASDRVVLLEDVLERVVAPAAAEQPVLALVADGMSVDVAHELVGELVRRGWVELAPEGADKPVVGLACIPTVTEACRTSLLSGTLTTGDAGREGRRFTANPALRAVSPANAAPVLFHRAQLKPEGAQRLPDEVRMLVEDPHHRVIGAVVNAVDDLLLKGGQLRPVWSPDAIPVLGALLDAAAVAQRTVVLLSDHGHVIDRKSEYRGHTGRGGERWREAIDPPADDEVLLRNSRRILLPEKPADAPVGDRRIICAASERIRYSKSQRDGYHGGATIREVVVPVRVMRPAFGPTPTGWQEIPTTVPGWWDAQPEADGPAPPPPTRRAPVEAQPSLFDEPESTAVASEHWIDALVRSEPYRERVERMGGRGRLEDDRVTAFIRALVGQGGTTTMAAVARAASVPEVRIAGVLVVLQRLLNVDAYPVLTTHADADTVELNVPLLRQQFGV